MNAADLEKIIVQINTDFIRLNDVYGVLSTVQKDLLIADIGYLFIDNIAREIKFALYDPDDKETVLFQNIYRRKGRVEPSDPVSRKKAVPADNVAFDVFVEFTEAFLELDSRHQDLLMNNTEFEWHTFLYTEQ